MILARLLDNGLQESALDEGRLGLTDELTPFFGQSFKWLMREGLVSVGSFAQTNSGSLAVNPVLTGRGYEVLGRSFQIGEENIELATVVRRVSSDQRSYSGAGDFTGGFVAGLMKALGT